MANNEMATKEAGQALAGALAGNSVLKELDVSGNDWYSNNTDRGDGAGFAQELAVGVKNNGALTSLNVSDNSLGGYYDDGSNWISDMTGIKALAAAIPECK